MCGNIACAVNTLDDEKDIPAIWRVEELSKLEGPKAKHPGRQEQRERGPQRPLQGNLGENVGESCVVEYDDECDDRDYCVPEDESATAKGDYVSLVENPERFTGYAGESAHMVWDAIYKENCFVKPKSHELRQDLPGSTHSSVNKASNDLRSVIQAHAPADAVAATDECLEKRVFYRIISGMHASISTHICYDYLNQTTGTWGPNLQCYQERLASHPDRISNLYFNYALVLRAVAKLCSHLQGYTYCSGDPGQDLETKNKVLHLANQAASGPIIFDEKIMFQDPAVAGDLKDDFRSRFRNVSRLMDCVGCDKCRLWGKLQTVGYGTALKVLFEFEEGGEVPLKRTELVALINTLARISHSLSALEKFRAMTPQLSIRPSTGAKTSSAKMSIASPSPLDDDGLDEDLTSQNGSSSSETSVMDDIRAELDLVWRTYIYVLKSWIGLPKKLLNMVVFELSRLWNFYLGLEVPEREYYMKMPTRDEL